ncbi:hypothetical protein AXY1_42 [Achromobacter phage AXY1]|nr:hypothetical protein AXY1_42 [Achromobacter phage AXY1]
MSQFIHFVMTPIGLFFIGFFAACALLAVMLVRGARNARVANEIYDGDGPESMDPKHELKLARDDQGHPLFTKWAASDQEGCRACGQTWDRNDPYPPHCEHVSASTFNVTQCVNCGKRWRTGGAIPRHCQGEKS